MNFGGCLLGAGILILFLTGSCTVFVFHLGGQIHSFEDFLMLASIDGLPILFGLFLIAVGWRMTKDRPPNRAIDE